VEQGDIGRGNRQTRPMGTGRLGCGKHEDWSKGSRGFGPRGAGGRGKGSRRTGGAGGWGSRSRIAGPWVEGEL
jgi:hypothetical protein